MRGRSGLFRSPARLLRIGERLIWNHVRVRRESDSLCCRGTLGPCLPLVRVSSVLNRNVREFGAAHMFDGSDITCWNSAQVRSLMMIAGSSLHRHVYIFHLSHCLANRVSCHARGLRSGFNCHSSANSPFASVGFS